MNNETTLKNDLVQQLPPNLPVPRTPGGIIVATVVFLIVTYLTYYLTNSKWSWFPGVVLGLAAGAIIG